MGFRFKQRRNSFDVNYDPQKTVKDAQEVARRLDITLEEIVLRAITGDKECLPKKTNECFQLFDLDKIWPNISESQLSHLQKCGFCQKLIKICYPILYLGSVNKAKGLFAPKEERVNIIDRQREIITVKKYFVSKCPFCADPVVVGEDLIILLPLWESQSNHISSCAYCQLLRQHAEAETFDQFKGHYGGCLDIKSWQVYPLYSNNDQKIIFDHIQDCKESCGFLALLRLEINHLVDVEFYKRFSDYSQPALRTKVWLKELVKRPIGDWISSWRFHFNPMGPFASRHEWAIWNDEDRILKMLGSNNLSEAEKIYKNLLSGKNSLEDCAQELKKMLPNCVGDHQFSVEGDGCRPLGSSWAEVEDYLYLDEESRKRGVSIEDLKKREEKDFEKIRQQSELEMYREKRYNDNLRDLHHLSHHRSLRVCTWGANYKPREDVKSDLEHFKENQPYFNFLRQRKSEASNFFNLPSERIAEIKAHLKECDDCTAFFEAYLDHYWENGEGCLGYGELLNFPEIYWFNRVRGIDKIKSHIASCQRCQLFLEVLGKNPDLLNEEHLQNCERCKDIMKSLKRIDKAKS